MQCYDDDDDDEFAFVQFTLLNRTIVEHKFVNVFIDDTHDGLLLLGIMIGYAYEGSCKVVMNLRKKCSYVDTHVVIVIDYYCCHMMTLLMAQLSI